jgi:coatomer subunit beta'
MRGHPPHGSAYRCPSPRALTPPRARTRSTQPWVLTALYSGHIHIYNYETQALVKTFESPSMQDAQPMPVRYAKFVARKQWVITGSDDMMVRVFNVNTMEKIREFEAHMDYIRSLEVHPTHPYVLTCSDDMQIKMWDWEKGWANTQCFDGHSHYVMMVKFNPKDSNSFASASLDRSVKVWSLGSPLPNYSLEGHAAGVNCIDYFQGGDKPYIASGSDDFTIKIFDYQTKACVHTLQQHTNNVSAVVFHPTLPIILSGSEDGTVRVWHSTTYRLESTLNYGLERCWTLGVSGNSNKVAIGYDEGVVVLQMGREMPVVSMDKSGKVLLATTKDVQAGAIRGVPADTHDGERIDFQTKTAGPTEVYPQLIEHNSNGRFVVVCGDGEYIIYTSQALRNKSFGPGLDFGWSTQAPNDYCVLDSQSRVHVFTDFKESSVITPAFATEALFGGFLVGVAGTEHVTFYTWAGKEAVRIDVAPKKVFWSDEGDHVALICDDSYYILAVNTAKLGEALARGDQAAAEACFEYLDEVAEQARTGQWAGDCFLYTNGAGRLNYYVGGEVITLAHLDREMLLLGFLPKENRLFLMDKSRALSSYQLLEPVLKYQTAVVRRDFTTVRTGGWVALTRERACRRTKSWPRSRPIITTRLRASSRAKGTRRPRCRWPRIPSTSLNWRCNWRSSRWRWP